MRHTENFKNSLYDSNDAVRSASLTGLGVGIAIRYRSMVLIKKAVCGIAKRYLIDSNIVESEAMKMLEYNNRGKEVKNHPQNFQTILGVYDFYTDEQIKSINDNFGSFMIGYRFALTVLKDGRLGVINDY